MNTNDEFVKISFYLAWSVFLFGPLCTYFVLKMGKDGMETIHEVLIYAGWAATVPCVLISTVYTIATTSLMVKTEALSLGSYKMGLIITTWFLYLAMLICLVAPIFAFASWNKKYKSGNTKTKVFFNFGKFSALGEGIIKKISVIYLIGIAYASTQTIWSATHSINDYFTQTMGRHMFSHTDVFTFVTHAAFVGFLILWILIWMERPHTKPLMITMIVINLITYGLTTIAISPSGTALAWDVISITNLVSFGIQGSIGLVYVVNRSK